METQKEGPIKGTEGGPIKLDVAANWTKNYRDKHPGETISQFFGKQILETILAQQNCLGIRFYYAYDKPLGGWQRCIVSISNFILKVIGNVDGDKHLVIVGVTGDGNDQLNAKGAEATVVASGAMRAMAATAGGDYVVGDQSAPCPGSPGCPHNELTGQR